MSSFVLGGSRRIATLQATASLFEHPATGARHLHIACDDVGRAFLVAFPTLPMVGDGRAHVLEHLLLCGSRRYPVRDPFFSMMGRSLATFMNAMTFADQTLYPYATTDRSDYFNLMDVYLDATFFPRLQRLDFLQEAWRPVLDGGRLALQGVVLNEMKGYTRDTGRALYQGLKSALFPGTTYAVNSGGDPLLIPQLTHADLVAFHAAHYHPSQATFISWGDVDPVEVQQRIEQRVLAGFGARLEPVVAPPMPRWSGVREVTIDVPAGEAAACEHRLQMAWCLGPEADLDAAMQARLLETALLAKGGGVLRQAIEAAGFGRMADYVGLDDSSTETVLHVGIDGLAEADLARARACITQALERAARDGVAADLLRAGIRELRWEDRRTTSGVHRLIGLARAAVRRHDLLAALDTDERLAQLERRAAEPGFVQRAVRRLLDEAPALAAHVRPDPRYVARRDALASEFVREREARLTEADRAAIVADAQALAAHQRSTHEDVDRVLPRITPAQVGREPRPALPLAPGSWHDQAFSLATQGLSHALLKVDASATAEADWPWLYLYAELLPQLGARGLDHEAAAVWRRLRVAALQARCQVHERPAGAARIEFTLTADALREEQGGLAEVLSAWFEAPDLADAERLRYLVGNHVRARVARMADETLPLAMLEAHAAVSAEGRVERVVNGLPALDFLATLQRQLAQPQGLAQIQAALQRVQALLVQAPRVLLGAGIEQDAGPLLAGLQAALGTAPPAAAGPALRLAPPLQAVACALHSPAQVNHCLALWSVPAIGHRDAPALAVLAELLQQQLLHPLLREQGGAYGAMANYRHERGTFACMSRSDPRLAATFDDIAAAIARVGTQHFTPVALDQAVLGVIKRLDRPLRGLAELEQAWATASAGVSAHALAAYRRGVLDCTLDDVRRAAAEHLAWPRAHRAAVMGWREQDAAGLAVVDLGQRVAQAGLAPGVQGSDAR
ncbi:peptidase M16 [Rubrivivax gelatinosus]|nr:peptidase M16 [Rubrivivax gelatinosus]